MANDHSGSSPIPDREQLERLRELFDRVLDRPEASRPAWIEANVADVDTRAALQALLDAEAEQGPLDGSAEDHLERIDAGRAAHPEGLIGQTVGAFRLTALLGRGGMATVFLGERESAGFRQQAAVKLLRMGLYSAVEQRLFLRERQALAALSHPNIARLLDGGVTEAGVPYLVLEYVDGTTITQYAAAYRLDLSERLRLFVVVCRAVAAAHRQLIVHRDLKPSNILVDADGAVKLLDFGIAKLLAEEGGDATRTGLAALTPEYAAPEQFASEAITTATDVYALGVLLHELLLGERPVSDEGVITRPSRHLARQAPPADATPMSRPALLAAIRGDLDNILLKAMAVEPGSRYAAAADLADDIERHLESKPVLAHPPSRWYRTRKFVRRHRGSVAVATAFTLGLMSSLALALWQARVATIEAENARNEALRANTTREFIESLFEPVREQVAEGRMPGLRELVGEGIARLQGNTDLGVAQRIDLLLMFSRLQEALAGTAQAIELTEQAHRLAVDALPDGSPLRIKATLEHGYALLAAMEFTRADPLLMEAETHLRKPDIPSEDLVTLLASMARLRAETGRPEEALRYARDELAVRLALHGEGSGGAAGGYNNLGFALQAAGYFDEAADAFERALAIDDTMLDPQSLLRAVPLGNLAQALYNSGRLLEARTRFAEALALHEAVALEAPQRSLTGALSMQVLTELALGNLDAAALTLDRLSYWAERTPATNNARAVEARLRARLTLESGDIDAAEPHLDRLKSRLPLMPEVLRRQAQGHHDLIAAEIALLGGNLASALTLARSAADKLDDKVYPPQVHRHALALLALVCAMPTAADDPDCDESRERAVAALAVAPYHDHPALLPAQIFLARVDLANGDSRAAVQRLRTALSAVTGVVADDSPRMGEARLWLAVALARESDCTGHVEALSQSQAAVARWSGHPFLVAAMAAQPERGLCS